MPEPTSPSRLPLLAPQSPRSRRPRGDDKGDNDDASGDGTESLAPETEAALRGRATAVDEVPVSPAGAPPAPTSTDRRGRPRRAPSDRGTIAWTMAKCLILGSFIALAFAIWLAARPVQNPGVQDCGAPLGFVIFTRTDVKLLPSDAPNAGDLIFQPTCRERVDSQLLKAIVAFGAFLGLGLVGAIIGLVDDRWQYHKAPRFETLLRERPKDAPGRLRAPPLVEEDELGVVLPQVEGPDVAILVILTIFTMGGLVVFGGIDDVVDAVGGVGTLGLLGLGLLAASTFVVAGLSMVLAEPDEASADASGQVTRMGLPAATELSLASAAAQRLLPGLGPLGLDAHALSAAGEPKDLTLRRLDARQALGVAVHVLLALTALAMAAIATRPDVSLPPYWGVLAGATGILAFIGLVRAPGRLRRLVVPPSPRAVREAAQASPPRAAGLLGSAFALTAVNIGVFVLAVSAVAAVEGGLPSTATLARLALVYLLAAIVGTLSPTPAGIGAFEPFAVLALLLCGVLPATAVAGVLLFRAATVWLPIVVGLVPFARLKRRHVI